MSIQLHRHKGVATLEIARLFNELPPMAVRETKRLLRAKHKDHVERAMRDEAAVFLERLKSPEARAALEAFFRKAPARRESGDR